MDLDSDIDIEEEVASEKEEDYDSEEFNQFDEEMDLVSMESEEEKEVEEKEKEEDKFEDLLEDLSVDDFSDEEEAHRILNSKKLREEKGDSEGEEVPAASK